MSIEFEADRMSDLTGKSFNRCFDELYEQDIIERQRYEEEARKYHEDEMRELWEAEMREQYEADMKEAENGTV
jgi:hypothetical protein